MKKSIFKFRFFNERHHIITPAVLAFIKSYIAVWAFSGDLLAMTMSGYSMDVPVIKYVYTFFSALDGWGIQNIFMVVGLSVMFYLVKDRQKSPYVSSISAIFAVSTVVGISYTKTGNWDCIFAYKLQFVLAIFVVLGYYFTYKNCILLIGYILQRKNSLLRREPINRLETLLFQKHPFAGPLVFILVCGIPWLVCFFPGTLQWDAHAQLWMYFGGVENTGDHPVIATQIMGGCLWLGRRLFGSDSIGLFIYTMPQFIIQSFTFSYACYLLRKLATPILISWGSLIWWGIFPFFPIWGYTMAKDTPFYIFILLLVTIIVDMVCNCEDHEKWWRFLLLLLATSGIIIFRNDGLYVVLVTLLCAIILCRKYWKVYLIGIILGLLLVISINEIYMPYHHIRRGNINDMLSIPLQQTARYVRDHYDEITEEEAVVLQKGFKIELEDVASVYNPICADGVKSNFQKYPDSAYLKSYFTVWYQQMLKHPDTYIEAFLNHMYGYFYPDMHDYLYDSWHYTAIFYIGNSDKLHDDCLDIEFGISNSSGRQILQNFLYTVEKMPVVSMLLSAGMHTYILLGQCAYLMAKKRKKAILLLAPAIFILLLRLVSPVNAYLRYFMPIMVILPVTVAWCYWNANTRMKYEKSDLFL